MSPQGLKRVAAACASIGDRAADERGFVSMHKLAGLMRAEVEFRPLLVEAMIASPKGAGLWKVLVDSETYPNGAAMFSAESIEAPLPPRLRNTIAHELLHTFSFRSEEFGFELELDAKETRAEAIARLEKETESFSPLLLLSQHAMESELESKGLSLDTLLGWRRRWSVSRDVVISRFDLFQSIPDFRLRYHPSISNVALCMGEWVNAEAAVLLERPIYFNFQDGVVPEFLLQLRAKGRPLLRDYFSDPEFLINGGQRLESMGTVSAGTMKNPRTEQLGIQVSVEDVPKQRGEEFVAYFRAEGRN